MTESANERRISLPASASGLVMPRGDWTIQQEKRRPDGSAVYYMLASASTQMNFSVYVDKTNTCSSASTCLDSALKNPQYKDAKALLRSDDRLFQQAQFFIDEPQGFPIRQANLLASAYVDGQWFDIHISKVGKERPDMAALLEFLKTVSIK
jgi:hypothetical protein